MCLFWYCKHSKNTYKAFLGMLNPNSYFYRISWNFHIIFLMNLYKYSCKKVYLHELILLLERVQYLSKMPSYGRFSIISTLRKDTITLYFKKLTFISFQTLFSIKQRESNRNQNYTSNYTWAQSTYHPIFLSHSSHF